MGSRRARRATATRRTQAPAPAEPRRPTPTADTAPTRGAAWLPAVGLVALTLIAYLPVRSAGWVWDDDAYVTANATLRSLDGLRRIWFEPGAVPQYYPMTFSTLWLEYRLWGLQPLGFHLTNVVLHAGAAVLVWRVLLQLAVPGALLAAALFAVHPVHVESVAWVTERKNVLSGVFYLGAMLAYLRAMVPAGSAPPARWGYPVALALFTAALLSKTVTCTLPVVLLVVVWWKRGRLTVRDVWPLLPFVALGVAGGLTTAWLERTHVGARGGYWAFSFPDRCLIAGRALWFYLGKLAWPSPLVFIYPRWRIDAAAWWQYLFPLGALAVLALLLATRRRLGDGALVAGVVFAVTLAPALGFVDVYPMRYSFVADHFQYLASVAPLALVAALAARGGRAGLVAGGVAAALCGALTWRQAHAYRDAETLWRDTLAKNPNAAMARVNLGHLLQQSGRVDEAMTQLAAALALEPDEWDVHSNLANALAFQGRLDEAVVRYQEAIRLAPGQWLPYNNLGNALAALGRYPEARAAYEGALRLRPGYAEANANLGNVLVLEGRQAEALPYYEAALRADPGFADGHNNLGALLLDLGRRDDAEAHFRAALRVAPNHERARAGLARALAERTAAGGAAAP